jgi:hypothetical protein
MEKIWVKKAKSFSKAHEDDLNYYIRMTPEERLDAVQFLREQYNRIGDIKPDENRKGLRRVIRIVQQA